MKSTMKALVYHSPGNISLDDVPTPTIQRDTDVIAKVTLSTICTSDIHIMHGNSPVVPPMILGHEFCAEIVEVGAAVTGYKPGDRVHVPPLSYCGECPMCKIGRVGRCENGGGFGIGQDGCQAEYIRITNANNCLIPIPDEFSYEDVLLLGDMLGTGWYGIQKAKVQEGQTVAVVGVGPVGLCTCVLLKKVLGCEVIAMDLLQYRVDLALKNGVADMGVHVTSTEDAVKQVMAHTGIGAPVVIETGSTEDSINLAMAITQYEGVTSTVSVFEGPVRVPLHKLVYQNLSLVMGIQRSEGMETLMEYIRSGVVDTRFVLTHKAPLNDILKGYDIFGNKEDGCVKWVVTPWED